MNTKFQCNDCNKQYEIKDMPIKCICGGMLNIEGRNTNFSVKDIVTTRWNMFRYVKSMPIESDVWEDITMGEGMTDIVKYYENVFVKMDYMMPTLSFKDRGAAALISVAKELNVSKVIQDSSGNAGNAVAAYASRAKIDCDIYVPEGTSSKKINQIRSHGATVNVVAGTREDTAKAALDAVYKENAFYASHVYNPFFYEGTKTYIYEVYEQFDGEIPENLIVPVGNGTLLLGVYYGLQEMIKNKWISKLPKIIAVQSSGCSPIYNAFVNNENKVAAVKNTGTQAEGIAIADPMRGKQILEAIRATSGDIILAPEEDIKRVRKELALEGFYVEPTTAATFAGYFKYEKENEVDGKVLLPLCGAGLKSEKEV